MVVWPTQVGFADMVLAPRATSTVAAIAAARRVNSAVLSLRLRPGRYRLPAPVRPVVTESLTSPDTRPGPRIGAGTPARTGRTRERCGHDCSGRSSAMRSLGLFA